MHSCYLVSKQTGSVAANVSSFNNRNGNVLPQAGDYTADMVGALAKPATNDGKRRVVVGDKLVEEAIKQDEILDTATNITYVLKLKLVFHISIQQIAKMFNKYSHLRVAFVYYSNKVCHN